MKVKSFQLYISKSLVSNWLNVKWIQNIYFIYINSPFYKLKDSDMYIIY